MVEEQNPCTVQTSSTNAIQNGAVNADDSDLPKCEREQFAEYILSSFNQLSDRNALKAMMDIRGFIKKSYDASLPERL